MKRLLYILGLGGIALGLVYASIALILLSKYMHAPYQVDPLGNLAAFMFLFIWAAANPFMAYRDLAEMTEQNGTIMLQHYEDHYGQRLTLFMIRHRVLLYAAICIPFLFFTLRAIASGMYHIVDTISTAWDRFTEWTSDAWFWIRYELFW